MVYAMLCRHSRSKVEYWAESLGIGRLEGAVCVQGVSDLEGQVGRSSSDGSGGKGGRSSSDGGGGKGGGVDETAIGHVDVFTCIYCQRRIVAGFCSRMSGSMNRWQL